SMTPGTCGFLHLICHCRLFSVSSCTVTVTGYIGQDVTLPCSYDVQANGVVNFCWGHGQVPRSKCSNTVLSSDNGDVTFRESPRYQLLSQVMQGDVSLTIVKAQKTDSGVYGCRVEIPGWFNDQKINRQVLNCLSDEHLTARLIPCLFAIIQSCLLL
uniref:Ig-like domain-containing protein n=1 Tax=Poecilia reticulata TaxID=8081 RepID=A0A3P9N9F6_POERE